MIDLKQGNCLELMRGIPVGGVDMILCDLPYGLTARNAWDSIIPFQDLWKSYKRIIKDNGVVCLFGNGMFTADLMKSAQVAWRYNLIWQKTTPTGFLNANRMPLRIHEDICIFYKKPPLYNPQKTIGHVRKVSTANHKRNCKQSNDYREHQLTTYDSTERYPTSILLFATDKQKLALHPTQKPVALLEYLIKTYTNEGDTVLDNCMGSGSTGVACVNTGRNFIGYEVDTDYFNTACARIETARKEFECSKKAIE